MESESVVVKEIAEANNKPSSSDAANNSSADKVVAKQKSNVKKPSTRQLLELEQDFIIPVEPSTVSYSSVDCVLVCCGQPYCGSTR